MKGQFKNFNTAELHKILVIHEPLSLRLGEQA